MNSNEFRKELKKIMPKYNWTVHLKYWPDSPLSATGIQSSGFNRLSTLQVVRREKKGEVFYDVKSAGPGTGAPWLAEKTGGTLAQALRKLQDYYATVSEKYSHHAWALESGRGKKKDNITILASTENDNQHTAPINQAEIE